MSKWTGAVGKGVMAEKNNYPQGRTGAETLIHRGVVGSVGKNATMGGGINRSTKGTKQR